MSDLKLNNEIADTCKNQKQDCPKKYLPFSVAMCVYGKDKAEWFDLALKSVIEQTVQPDEIILVVDGPIPISIQSIIDKYSSICNGVSLNVTYMKENKGHGIARRVSLKNCKNELVALMDADDICVSTRFEMQLSMFEEDSSLDIVGGNIAEFIAEPSNVIAMRNVPSSDLEIKEYMKKRCPMNQMTVMFKKSSVNKVGGYMDWYCNEDYYLWIRMMLSDMKFANISEILVNVRVGEELYQRRGGKKYFMSEIALQKYMKKNAIINTSTYIVNCLKRFVVQMLLPNKIRGWVFQKFARNLYFGES